MVHGLLHSGPGQEMVEPLVACCDKVVQHFEDKITRIRHDLDTTVNAVLLVEESRAPTDSVLLGKFWCLFTLMAYYI